MLNVVVMMNKPIDLSKLSYPLLVMNLHEMFLFYAMISEVLGVLGHEIESGRAYMTAYAILELRDEVIGRYSGDY